MPKFVLLWTDAALFLVLAFILIYSWRARRLPALRASWRAVFRRAPAACSALVLVVFGSIALLDSIHFRPQLPPAPGAAAGAAPNYAPVVHSALDLLLDGTALAATEKTYSAPLAAYQFTKESLLLDGVTVRDFPRLRHGGAHLEDPPAQRGGDIARRLAIGAGAGVLAAVALAVAGLLVLGRRAGGWRQAGADVLARRTAYPWLALWCTAGVLLVLVALAVSLAGGYHVLGTDRTGNDVLWQALKSLRTALVIGFLTLMAMLPPALFFGIAVGYFKGRADTVIQYLYTILTSIPGVLLIAACVLLMQGFIDRHPELYGTAAERADLRLFLLCMVLGLTGWAGLCRLLRAEALKLRELEYVQAARAFGVSHWRIMLRHLLPNVTHIVLITAVLEFSGLVLYEAVLSYLGIGVDATTRSFGSMIDMARLEMSRDPMVWWNLLTAFGFMLALVLAANLFADAVRDAFDPNGSHVSPRRQRMRRALARQRAARAVQGE